MLEQIDPTAARTIIKALSVGTVPVSFARYLLVGQEKWFQTALKMMADTGADRHFEVRFVRARYGGGKTLLLRCLEHEAHALNWATAYVLLKRDQVELDKYSTFVREVAHCIDFPDGSRGIHELLSRALTVVARGEGFYEGGAVTLAVHERSKARITQLCRKEGIPHPFWLALQDGMTALLDRDEARLAQVSDWLAGGPSVLVIDPSGFGAGAAPNRTRATATTLKAVAASAAEEQLRLIALLCSLAGYAGLYVAVDELEMLGRLPKQRKYNSLQVLREMVDQNDPRRMPPSTCLFLAATPEMFEDADKFPSYKALQDRIESVPTLTDSRAINYRANVIDLDKTELGENELMVIGTSILTCYERSGEVVSDGVAERLPAIAKQIVKGGYVMARPRLMCKCVTDLVNGSFGARLEQEVAQRDKLLHEQREKELGTP